MPFIPAAKVSCVSCQKTVYPNEQIKVSDTLIFHPSCFKCLHCQKNLSLSNFSAYQGSYYCKPHFLALFKTSGGKYDQMGGKGGQARKISSGHALDQTVQLNKESLAGGKSDQMSQTVQFARRVFESEKVEVKKRAEKEEFSSSKKQEVMEDDHEAEIPKKDVQEQEPVVHQKIVEEKSKVEVTSTANTADHGHEDLFQVIKKNTSAAMEAWFQKNSIADCFKLSPEGVSSIEFAFTSGNLESGRFLVHLLQKNYTSIKNHIIQDAMPKRVNEIISNSPWAKSQNSSSPASTMKVESTGKKLSDTTWLKNSDVEIKSSYVLANTVGPSVIGKLSENVWREKEEPKPAEGPKIIRRISNDSSWIQSSGNSSDRNSLSDTRPKNVLNDNSWVKGNSLPIKEQNMEIEDDSHRESISA